MEPSFCRAGKKIVKSRQKKAGKKSVKLFVKVKATVKV